MNESPLPALRGHAIGQAGKTRTRGRSRAVGFMRLHAVVGDLSRDASGAGADSNAIPAGTAVPNDVGRGSPVDVVSIPGGIVPV